MSKQKTNSINKETDICDIGLSTRSYNALTQAGIEKVGDIICKDILQIKEISEKNLFLILRQLYTIVDFYLKEKKQILI